MHIFIPPTFFTQWFTDRRCGPTVGRIRRTHELARRKVLTMALPEGGVIRCTRGCIWMTRDGAPDDILLRGGECHTSHPGAGYMIEALENSEVEVFC